MAEGAKTTPQPRGLVFQIIHGSFVDGPGIRTTVFLKGCPLSCLWCCNPEGQRSVPELKVTVSLCNACGNCVGICPEEAIRLSTLGAEEPIVVDRARCTDCLKCVDVCYTGALDRFGVYYSVDELLDVVRRDQQYYLDSGGGVTIGGGEPTVQAGFLRAFLRRCRQEHIHTALDTCGYTTSESAAEVLEEADLLLFDIKGLPPAQHFVDTAVSNETILANLLHLSEIGKPIIVRLPVIPGHTDSAENIAAVGELLAGLRGVQRVDLMAYHRYGIAKYQELGREYRLKTESLAEERVNDIRQRLEGYGLKVQIGG